MATANQMMYLDLSSALSDVAGNAADDGQRRSLRCEPFPAGADAQVCVAAWHGVLHWLRYNDEPVITCLLNARARKSWPIVTETSMETSLGELLATVRNQWMQEESGWFDLDDSAHAGLLDQLRCHAMRLHDDRDAEVLRAEFELVTTQSGWEVECAASRFTETYQRLVMELWRQTIVRMIESPEALLSTQTYGGGGVCGPVVLVSGNLVERFVSQVKRHPLKVAVVDSKESHTYAALNEISSSWAHSLSAAGVTAGQCVGVAFERNWKMVAAQLAVLKLGAVFVPMDAGLPESRLLLMADDTTMSVALTEDACMRSLAAALPGVKFLSVNDLSVSSASPDEFSGKGISTDDLAYVMFTSGSTGRPKGVKVSHGNLLNFALDIGNFVTRDGVVSQFAPFTFDASVAEFYICVLSGGTLVILTSELIENPDRLQDYLTEQRVTFAAFPPQYARHLSPSRLPHLKTLVTAGSAPDHELIKLWQPHLNYVNGYGPTETTVLSTVWRASRVPGIHEPIVMGSPISNTEVRVVNRFNRSLPRGVIGELLIGGAGVTQGYMKRQDLTSERFSEVGRTRWYRSGDLSCFNAADELIFAGRVDNQIKLRGHRLEPGEVEIALACIPGIKQAAVLVVDIEAASQLVAFCLGERQPEEALRERLRRLVPAWAIPNRIVWLDCLPLTVNGKTDYKQLRRDWQRVNEPQREQEHADALEAEVAEIWSGVLQRPNVSRDDHFIHLGGDSLTALVVMSALRRLGYTSSSSQLLAHPRLADFAALLKATGRSPQRDYAPCEGVAPLSPIQGWFFDLPLGRPGTFCQSLIFEMAGKLEAGRLQTALARLIRHHDQLRARFVRGDGEPATFAGWHQEVLAELPALVPMTHLEVPDAQLDQASVRCRSSLADELHIERAPLFRMALLTTPTRSRVVWVLHHLIVDTISHGILLEDLRQLYERASEDIESVLPGKSISYLSWSSRLLNDCIDHASCHLSQWQPVLREIAQAEPLPLAREAAGGQPLEIAEARLSRGDTARLIEDAAACYHQSPEEIVLAATYLALARTFKVHRIAIDIEWHGRDEKVAGAQGLDRTIGWFTSAHPLCMTVPAALDAGSWLINLKETRARIPNRGRDFHALRYLSRDAQVRAEFAGYRAPQVLFNFSGVVQRRQGSWRSVPAAAIELGEGNASPYALCVESEIRDGELMVSLYHQPAAWPAGGAGPLSRAIAQCLKELIAHCCEPSHERWTPADFPQATLTQSQLEELPRSIKAVFPLTDMQQTMFRHKETYQVFTCYRMPRRLNESRWRAAVADWIGRHDCLRTYIKEWSGGHVNQVVLETVEPPVSVHRTAPGNGAQLAQELMEAARQSQVVLTQAPLFDIQTVDDGGDDFRLVLTIHHIIHDGWSIELLLADLLQTYRYYCGETDRRPAAPLASLADVVAEQSRLRASAEWRAYWAGLPWQSAACPLPEGVRIHSKAAGNAELQPRGIPRLDTKLYLGALEEKLVWTVRAKARSLGVTINSLWLTGYVCLLRFLGGQRQVRCGVIHSGRMEQIPGVETITGCCVNTLPLVLSIEPTHTLSEILADVNSQLEKMRTAAVFPLSDIHSIVRPKIDAELFSTLFNIESRLYGARQEGERPTLVSGYESTNYSFIFGLIERTDCAYGVRIGYDANRYDSLSVERWLAIYENCMQLLIESVDVPWNRLQILPEDLRRKMVLDWNATERPYPHDHCVAGLFREQAARLPEHPALLYKDQQLTYRELDTRSDELARLLQAKGVKPETVVGLVAERSLEGVIAILAIFKAGGAYVPLDPKYPASRIRHMVEDVGCKLAIFQRRALANVMPPDIAIDHIYLDEPVRQAADLPATVSTVGHHSRQLAYVMYTSGSTGNPKGVMIEQRSIVRLVKGTTDIAFAPEDRILLTSAPGFDVTTFEIWSALLNGLTLAIADEDTLLDPERLTAEIRDKRIATLWLIAPLFNRLVQEKPEMFAGVKQLMLGGDALSAPHVRSARRANPDLQIINGYGPTENTSFSTYHFLGDADSDCIPIGRPLTNSTAYVFNNDGQLLPPGVDGELVVGGPGVARGYLNQPALTAEKFIRDPFSSEPGASLYRTGDLVRWREDGLIDFLGRIDDQVKIRGFRVELGEIESAMAAHENVKQALVLLRKQDNREQLIAYVVPTHAGAKHEEIKTGLVRSIVSRLQASLPDYMVPTAFVMLEAMPRNANGKIDRGRLPEPGPFAYTHNSFVEPANDCERVLWTIWKEILGVDSFGVTDSFFAIGGDSILAIQVVARAAKQNVQITTRQLIEEKTIRNLARRLEGKTNAVVESKLAIRADRSDAAVTGEQRLLPIQLKLLQDDGVDLHHYNQYAWIDLPEDISREKLRTALSAIVARHDVLRLRFRETPSGWVAHYRADVPEEPIVEEDPSEIPPEWRCAFIEDAVAAAQASLDIKQGRLCKWLWIRDGAHPRLLWVMHHLIVDAVSWRVLLGDLEAALAGRALAPKSSSYQEWAASLHERAFNAEIEREKPFWLRQLSSPAALVKPGEEGQECLENSTEYVEVALSSEDTSRLLHKAGRYYDTRTQELLIAALTRTLGEWLQSDDIRIDLEGHGRAERDDLDLSQTVGWFTALYPVHFGEARTDLGRHIRQTKERLSAVPDNGIGYGILSFLTRDEEVHAARTKLHFSESDVLFNYLGQFDAAQNGGSSVSHRRQRTHALRINAFVGSGALSVRFDYSKQRFEPHAVAELARQYLRTLREIIEHCAGGTTENTPAPFPLAGLSQAELSALRSKYGSIRDIYPCTGMQQGLLLYTGRDPGSGVYLTQLRIDLDGVEPARLRRSWQELMNRHAILRTAFADAGQSCLLQLVLAEAPLPWRELDARDLASPRELEDVLANERVRPFDMSTAPLMRLLLVRMTDQLYRLSWTHHHALLDGWSMALLIRELFDIYSALARDSSMAPAMVEAPPYKGYIEWLQHRDREAAARYWRTYLQGADVTPHAGLPVLAERARPLESSDPLARLEQKAHTVELAADATALLTRLAGSNGVSLSTLMLAAWGLLLSKYGSTTEVLFGYASSGRPASLPGVESMVGLFINSLPLRLQIDGDHTLVSWLGDIQRRQLDHEEQGFIELAEIQRLGGLHAGQTLFGSLVVVENYPLDRSLSASMSADSLRIVAVEGVEQNDFPLNFVVYPGESLTLKLVYQTHLFDDETVSTMLRRLSQLLISFGKCGEQKIAQLSMLTREEQMRAILTWNDTRTGYPDDRCLSDLFTAQARARSRATAIVSGTERWTYRKLSNRMHAISTWLSRQGVAPGDKVALSLHKEPDLIAAMIAIVHTGAAYVPVALDCPSERRAFIAADAGIKWTLTKKAFAAQVETSSVTTLLLDEVPSRAEPLESRAEGPQAIAYVIYTSGTTGRPKGVAITHRNLINFCSWLTDTGLCGPGDALTQFAPYTFDASAGEIFTTLLVGAELHLLAEELIQDPRAMERYLSDHRIRFAGFPPPYLQQLDPARVPRDITILTAGSAPTPDLVERWGRHCGYINAYGPTETTILSSAWKYDSAELGAERTISIGRPISNTVIYVVDCMGQLCAPGLVGEILIGGDGVAQGYVNRPELTEQQFIRDPWTPGGRLYRTGDLGRWLPDGRLEFIGRRDRQVKVRGFRMELGEIESRLREHPAVKDAVVAVRGTDADAQILAWVVFQSDSGLPEPGSRIESLRGFLRQTLPPYMLPQAIVPLDQLPLTAHGKVDEDALPQLDHAALVDQAYVAPRTEHEKRLTEIWAAVLKCRPDEISATANFFELGGHSLLAMRVISRLREEWGVDVGVADLFKHPLLEDQAVAIQHAARSALPPVTPVERDGPLPLSFAQQRLWFMEQIEGVDETYHIPGAIGLTGVLDREALRRALDRIVARHEILRTTFKFTDGKPVQQIGPADSGFTLKEHDLSGQLDAQSALQRLMDEEVKSPFDFENGPLARGRLVVLGKQEHVLLITLHHVVMDGWSIYVMLRELGTLYRAYRAGQADPMPALAIQYADYAVWQRRCLAGERLQEQCDYWQRTLEGAPALLDLPTDWPRPASQQFKGELFHFDFDEPLTMGLKALSQRHGTTMFMTLLAGWSVVLSRLSGQEDVVIGAPVANRTPTEVEPLIGCFVNAIAVRLDLSGAPTVSELLQRAKMQVLGAQQHQQVPFEQVVEIVRPPRSLAYNAIFQVWFNWLNIEASTLDLGDLQVTQVPAPHSVSKFDLKLTLAESGPKLTGSLEYATALFDRATVERHVGYLRRVLEAMVADEHELAERLSMLGDAERQRVIAEFNATRTEYPREQCIHQLFEAQVAREPHAAAVEYDGWQLTYDELNRRANQIAHELIALGVRPDDRVAICVERSLDMVAGVLGILKAGGAYVPLDPKYPAERLAYLLQDCAPVALLIQASASGNISLPGESERPIPIVALDEKNGSVSRRPDHNPDARSSGLSARSLAYVIYTSGSTGQPKGVMVEHTSAVNFWQVMSRTTHRDCGAGSRVGLNATYTFDMSLKGLLQLLSGHCVVLIPQAIRADGEAMLRFIDEYRIDALDSTPSQLDGLLRAGLIGRAAHPPTSVYLGGEPIGPVMWEALKGSQRIHFFNMYGPTECTVDASIGSIRQSAGGPNIGKPIANTQIYILNAHLQPAPIGVAGEMYLGGVQVARGYLNRPELTSQRFITDPFSTDPQARLYKTGDLGRWCADGSVEYIGRNDFQVKIRGFRIELGEIEAKLRACEGVREAAVIAREDPAGEKRLVAYVVAHEGRELSVASLREELSRELAEYMLPNVFVSLGALPLTSHGKLDRQALPAPDDSAVLSQVYEAPMGAVEEAVAQAWRELLGLQRVSRHDHFFELGGHSLLVISLIERLRQKGLSADVRMVFTAPTLCALAAQLDSAAQSGTAKFEVPPNLIAADCTAITPDLLPLVNLTQQQIDSIVASVPGGVPNIQDIYPLAPLQEGILYHHLRQAEQGSDPYLLRAVVAFDGRERLDQFLGALQTVIKRHDILRSAVHWQGLAQPVQVVYRDAPLPVQELALQPDEEILPQLLACTDPRGMHFDLRCAPLMSAFVAHEPRTGEWLAAILRHHVACDHVAMELILEEIRTLLRGAAGELHSPLPYRNFIAQTDAIPAAEHEAYFREQLADVQEPTAPFGVLNVQGDGEGVEEARVTFPELLAQRIRESAREHRVTPAVLFHIAWAQVLAQCTGREDVVFGTVLSGRLQGLEGAGEVVGMFLNTLPIRIPLAGISVGDAVRDTHRRLSELLAHEQASLALAQRCSGVSAPFPLFTTLLNYRHSRVLAPRTQTSAADRPMLEGMRLLSGMTRNNYPLTLSVEDLGQGFGLTALCVPGIDASRLIGYVETAIGSLVRTLVESPLQPMRTVNILPHLERELVVYAFNRTQTPYPADRLIHELFEAQAAKQPNALALVYADEELSYAALNRRANQVAHELIGLGVRPDDRVALCTERSVSMVVGLLGILKAGGAYVPLDPGNPADRLAYMLKDCAPAALLVQSAQQVSAAALSECTRALPIVVLEGPGASAGNQPDHNPDARSSGLSARSLAYVIYTSGSTGQPKGVMVEHTSAVNFWQVMSRTTHRDCGAGSRVGLNATYTFDMSLKGLLQLLSGHCVVLIPQAIRADGEAMLRFIDEYRIDALDSTPSQLDGLLRAGLIERAAHPPASVYLGGEPIGPVMWEALKGSQRIHFFNMYGPTECTVDASIGSIRQSAGGPSIGKPIANTQIYILNAHLQPVPIGVSGELYLGGVQVARGYLNRPELTAQRFVTDPFSDDPQARLYKTGDLGRWCADGSIEYIGRKDLQVKIRGFRIELGEIEVCLMRHPAVREAVVIARDREQGDKQLVAFITQSAAASTDALRAHLRAELPDYMVPAAIVCLDAWPLTTNGKVDRDALPEPGPAAFQRGEYEAPRNSTEQRIAQIWQELLGVERVGRNDSFFDLGGDSISLIRMFSRLVEQGITLSVADVYRLRTVSACSDAIAARSRDLQHWLQSNRWEHRLLSVDRDGGTATVLLLDQRGTSRRRDLQNLLAEVDAARRPDFVRICDDMEACAQSLARDGLAALAQHSDDEEPLRSLPEQLKAYQSQLASATRDEVFSFSPIQQNFAQWQARDGFQCIPVTGWYSGPELQDAFARLACEQDLLRSIPGQRHLSWELLAADAVGAAAAPVVDLKISSPSQFDRQFKRAVEKLRAGKKKASLPYAAAWVSASDTRHYLLLVIDHLIWDGASAGAAQQRLAQLLMGTPDPIARTYRDYAHDARRMADPRAWELLQQRFGHAELAVTMAATQRALEAKAHLPLQHVRMRAPLTAPASPADQAFQWFKHCVLRLTGLASCGMVLCHYGRQLADHAYFDHVGLFLDKIPFAVTRETKLENLASKAANLHEQGIHYVGLESAGGDGRTPLLPRFDYEVLFNFQADGTSERRTLRERVMNAGDMHRKLQGYHGILFEAFDRADGLIVHCAFRGEAGDVKALLDSMPGASLIESGSPSFAPASQRHDRQSTLRAGNDPLT